VSIIFEDLERSFDDDGVDSKLSSYTLKLCMSKTPCHDCQEQMSSWLTTGKLCGIEVFCVPQEEVLVNNLLFLFISNRGMGLRVVMSKISLSWRDFS